MTDTSDNPVATQPKRRTGKVKAVQAEIIERRLAGEPIRAIQADLAARGIKLTADTIIDVYDEFLAIRAQQDAVTLEMRLVEQIERVEWVVAEARSAWEKSCEPKTVTKTRKDGSTDKYEIEGEGNPAYHQAYLAALAQLEKLLGLAAAQRLEVTGKDGGPIEIAGAKSALAAAFEALAETTAPEDDADTEGEGET